MWGVLPIKPVFSALATNHGNLETMPKLDYDVCARCGQLFDDQGENGWWIRDGLWWHECDSKRPARIVVRKLELTKPANAA
jgi:hypothetical protein